MKLNKIMNQIINENSTSTYSYGCVMLYFDFPEMEEIQSVISPHHIYTEVGDSTYGLEDEPHCTLLYGLHDEVTDEDVTKIIDRYTFYTHKLHKLSLFENGRYDVLKYTVSGDALHQINTELKAFPHTTSFPTYNPHLTIGYLSPGMGNKYIHRLNRLGHGEYWVAPTEVVFSKSDGSRTIIPIKID